MPPSRLQFPILAFDESELLLSRGSALNPKWLTPGESFISILWKFASANGLPGDMLMHLFRPYIDPSEGLALVPDDIELVRLCRILRLQKDVLRVSLLDAAIPGNRQQAFRHCRRCAAHGFHSVLYQLEDEDHCPAHHESLDSRCHHCGSETPYIVCATVIDAPFRCSVCGFHFSYGRLPRLSTLPAMRRQDRLAIRGRLLLRLGKYVNAVDSPRATPAVIDTYAMSRQ